MYNTASVNEELNKYKAFIKVMYLKKNVKEFADYHEAYIDYLEAEEDYRSASNDASYAQEAVKKAEINAIQKRSDYINSEWLPSLKADKAKEAAQNFDSCLNDAESALEELEFSKENLQEMKAEFESKKLSFVESENAALAVVSGIARSYPQYAIGYYGLANFYAQSALLKADLWYEICTDLWKNKLLSNLGYIRDNIKSIEECAKKYSESMATAHEFVGNEETAQFKDFFAETEALKDEFERKLSELKNHIDAVKAENDEKNRIEAEARAKEKAINDEKRKKKENKCIIIVCIVIAIFILLGIIKSVFLP